jgi:hypothetical protein
MGKKSFNLNDNEEALYLWNKAIIYDSTNVTVWDNLFRYHWSVDLDYPQAAIAANKLVDYGISVNPEILKKLEIYKK